VGVSLAALCSLQDSPSNDLTIHFKLTDILKRLTCEVVCLVHGGYLVWIKGKTLEKRIKDRHDAPPNRRERKLSVARETGRIE
jgi:hypothetical protein